MHLQVHCSVRSIKCAPWILLTLWIYKCVPKLMAKSKMVLYVSLAYIWLWKFEFYICLRQNAAAFSSSFQIKVRILFCFHAAFNLTCFRKLWLKFQLKSLILAICTPFVNNIECYIFQSCTKIKYSLINMCKEKE